MKFHLIASVPKRPGSGLLQIFVERMGVGAVDLDLGEHRKARRRNSSAQKAPISASPPGSCAPNWLQGKPSTVRPSPLQLFVQRLQPGILRGEAALRWRC